MFLEKEYRVAQERRRDTLAWAEKERLVHKIRAGTLRPAKGRTDWLSLQKRYQLWMARLGARLVRWGNRLQARYADTWIAASAIHQERCSIERAAKTP